MRWALAAALLACGEPQPSDDPPGDTDLAVREPRFVPLSDAAQRTRVSVALRGVRPTPEELDQPLDALIDAWLADPRFGETIRDLYAEVLLMRSLDLKLPQLGPLARTPTRDILAALSEEPLALIAEVATSDRPFSEIVTADTTVLDRTAASIWRGHAYDPDGPDVQTVRHTDRRPAAGILSTNALWARHRSNGSNHHRGRANLVADALLCGDFLARDVPITGEVDLADDDAVAEAVDRDPTCVSCHQSLDPLAAHLWRFNPVVDEGAIALAYLGSCQSVLGNFCYPIEMHTPELSGAWLLLGLRAPGYYGVPTETIGDVGHQIAEDPRFARCAARRFWGWFTETDPADVPPDVVDSLQSTFTSSGLRAQALARAVVTHPRFLAARGVDPADDALVTGVLSLRPEQLRRSLADVAGFSWVVTVDELVCQLSGLLCYGDVDLLHDDTHGLRAMLGGIDGSRITRPTHTPTPVRLLGLAAAAEEAAGYVVAADFEEPDAAKRRLLTLVDRDTADPTLVRAQLVALHTRIFGEVPADDDPDLLAAEALWNAVAARRTPTAAWRATVAAMLQHPRFTFY